MKARFVMDREEKTFADLCDALGYEIEITAEKDFIDATAFGDINKTYIVGMKNVRLVAKGPRGTFATETNTIGQAEGRFLKWALE